MIKSKNANWFPDDHEIQTNTKATSRSTDDKPDETHRREIANAVNGFGSSLAEALCKHASMTQNVLISPINLYSSLDHIRSGSQEETSEEIWRKVTRLAEYTRSWSETRDILNQIIKSVEETKETIIYTRNGQHDGRTVVEMVTGIFVSNGCDFDLCFQLQAQPYHASQVFSADFRNDAGTVTEAMNEFISKHTRQKITKLLAEPVATDSGIILLPCVYFKANWSHHFEPHLTKSANFNTGSEIIRVPMMAHRRTKLIPYANLPHLHLEAVSLYYSGRDFSMFVLLPNTDHTLDDVISSLNSDAIHQIVTQVSPTKVEVRLPRMKLKCAADLSDDLEKLGMKTTLSGRDQTRISKVVHAAEIEINEYGVDAESVIDLGFTHLMDPTAQKIEFHVNRAFLLFIHHHRTRTMLFLEYAVGKRKNEAIFSTLDSEKDCG